MVTFLLWAYGVTPSLGFFILYFILLSLFDIFYSMLKSFNVRELQDSVLACLYFSSLGDLP